MPAGRQPPPEVPARSEHHGARREGQARPQRAVAQPALQVQREAEQEPAVGDHQHRHRGQTRHLAGRTQHGQVQQRIAAPVRDPPFHAHEHRGQHQPEGDTREHPPRPVLLVTQHQRQHHQEHRGHRDGQPGQVPGRVQRPPDRGHRDVDDRDVKQRHELPGQQHDQREPAPPRGRGRIPYQWISDGHDSSLRPDRRSW
jgi:hypothetical protein